MKEERTPDQIMIDMIKAKTPQLTAALLSLALDEKVFELCVHATDGSIYKRQVFSEEDITRVLSLPESQRLVVSGKPSLEAIKLLFDRGFGKPTESIKLEVTKDVSVTPEEKARVDQLLASRKEKHETS
jgi:hypothetical protein